MEGVSSKEWQNLSSGGSVQGADTATLAYSSIESCSEGVYRCVVTNVAGEDKVTKKFSIENKHM